MKHKVILGDEINILPGFPFDSNKFTNETGKQLIRIRDLQTHASDTNFIGAYHKNYVIKKGDILIGMDGDFNIVKWKGADGLLNQRILKIAQKSGSKVDIDYAFFLLNPILLDINEKTAATTVKHLSTYDISRLRVNVPPLPTQRKIARILSTIDGQIEKTEAIIAKYQAVKQGMLQDLFTRGIDVRTGQLRPRYEDAPELYQASALGMIPKEWAVRKLNEVCSRIQDGTHFSPRTDPQGRFLYITSKNIRMGYLDLGNVDYVDAKEHEKIYRRCNTLYGDVLLTKDGANTGNVSLNTIVAPISLLSSVAFLRGIPGVLNNNFLLQSLSGERMQTTMKDQMSGNAIPRITLSKINNITLGAPPINEQEHIIKSLQAHDEILKTEQRTLSKLQLLKQGMMQDLLSGKVEVTA